MPLDPFEIPLFALFVRDVVAIGMAVIFGRLMMIALLKLAGHARSEYGWVGAEAALKPAQNALFFLFAMIMLALALPFLHLPAQASFHAAAILNALCIAGFGWLAMVLAQNPQLRLYRQRFAPDSAKLLARAAAAVIGGLTLIGMALVIPGLYEFALSVFVALACAALAASVALANVIAGLQLTFTGQLRLGDDVAVQGERGIVEELDAAYAMVRLADARCLVVPLRWFLEQPFENRSYHARKNPQTLPAAANDRAWPDAARAA